MKILLLFIFNLFLAQHAFAIIECSELKSTCLSRQTNNTDALIENGYEISNKMATSESYTFAKAPSLIPDGGHIISSADPINCHHPDSTRKNSNQAYESQVSGFCTCIESNIVNTIVEKKLSCEKYVNYLSLAKTNMQDNSWRFAGAGWMSSFHSNITVINTLNSAFKSKYSKCSVNKLLEADTGVEHIMEDLLEDVKRKIDMGAKKDSAPKSFELKACLEKKIALKKSSPSEYYEKLDHKMKKLFGVDSKKFSENIRNEFNQFTKKSANSDSQCISMVENTIFAAMPSWEQLESVLKIDQKNKITPQFVDDLYSNALSGVDLKDDEKNLFDLLNGEPRLKILFTKDGSDTLKAKEHLFSEIKNAIYNKNSDKGKFANMNLLPNILKSKYYADQVGAACDDLSNEFVALICADDDHMPLGDRSFITKIPDNYNLLGDAGENLDSELSSIQKVCLADAAESNCNTMPFEAVYCEYAREKSLETADAGISAKLLDADKVLNSAKNLIYNKYIHKSKSNEFDFKSLSDVLADNPKGSLGGADMCKEIDKSCSKHSKESYKYGICRFEILKKSKNPEQDAHLIKQMTQYMELMKWCKKNAGKSSAAEICQDEFLQIGVKLANGTLNISVINAGTAQVTIDDNVYDERSDKYSPQSYEPTVAKVDGFDSGIIKNATDEIENYNKAKEELSFSSSKASTRDILNSMDFMKNNHSFDEQYVALKNIKPAVAKKIQQKENENIKEKEQIEQLDVSLKDKKLSTRERELFELEKKLLEKNLKDKEKSLLALKDQADRLTQLVSDLESRISNAKPEKSRVAGSTNINPQNNNAPVYTNNSAQPSFAIGNQAHTVSVKDEVSGGSGQSGNGRNGFNGNNDVTSTANNEQMARNAQDRIERDRASLALKAVPMSLVDLTQIQSVDKLNEILDTYGLSNGPFYLYDKETDLLTKVIGYKVENDQIVYEVLRNGQLELLSSTNLKNEKATRMPAAVPIPEKIETPTQLRKYSLEILSSILKQI